MKEAFSVRCCDKPTVFSDQAQLHAIRASSLQSLLASLEVAAAIYQTNPTLESIPHELAEALDDVCLKLGRVKDLDTTIDLLKQHRTLTKSA
jgi:hypothetical protein